MSKQYNKVQKRNRLKEYRKRRKADVAAAIKKAGRKK